MEILDTIAQHLSAGTGLAVVVLFTAALTMLVTTLLCGRDIKDENCKLKTENHELRVKNRQLTKFAELYQEEQDKAYVRGYYDSIGVYDR